MARTIWKFECDAYSQYEIAGFERFLQVGMQNGKPYVWAICDPDSAEKNNVIITVAGTGRSVPDEHDYVGTFQEGWFVGHVFYKVEATP